MENTVQINWVKLKFAGLFIASLILSIGVIAAIWGPPPSKNFKESRSRDTNKQSVKSPVLEADQLLHKKWADLEEQANNAGSLSRSQAKTGEASRNALLANSEEAFSKTMDSIQESGEKLENKNELDNIISSFRLALKNRQTQLSSTTPGGASDKNGAPDQQKLLKAQADLQARDALVTNLQNELKLNESANIASRNADQQKLQQLQADLQTKDALLAGLQNQLKAKPIVNNVNAAEQQKLAKLQADLQSKDALVASLQNQLKAKPSVNNVNVAEQQKLAKLQADLQSKDALVASLQNQLKAKPIVNNVNAAEQQKLAKLQADLQSKDALVASLQSQLKAKPIVNNVNAAEQQKLAKLQADLQSKDALVASLQSQLKAKPSGNNGTVVDQQKLAKLQADLQTKDALVAKLQNQLKSKPSGNNSEVIKQNDKLADENKFLKWALRSEVTTNTALANKNNELKISNVSLSNQVTELKKSSGNK